jgi:FMN-dependent NADH-azoreductase
VPGVGRLLAKGRGGTTSWTSFNFDSWIFSLCHEIPRLWTSLAHHRVNKGIGKPRNGQIMRILHLSCSPRGQAAESHRLSQKIIGFLLRREPTATLVTRVVGSGLPHIEGNYAAALGAGQATPAEIARAGSFSQSEELIRELENSDVLVIGTPMHNFTVPSGLKAWIDHVVRVRRTFHVTAEGRTVVLRDRPVFVAVSSGGRYSGPHARQPDFLTPYLKAVLAAIGLHDPVFFSVEGSALGPDAVAEARRRTEEALQAYFSAY